MSAPKRGSHWAELSMTFDQAETTIPRKREKTETVPVKKFLPKPVNVIGFKRPENIQSLSKLVQACEPKNTADLSVSKRKQSEIAEWFTNLGEERKPRVLVISGPSGCGKTAALKIIARDNDYEIVEWTTPMDSVNYDNFSLPYATTGQADKFLDFLLRVTRYNSLTQANSRRLLLVKDVPNVYFVKKDLFFTLLENYFQYGKEPLVFVFPSGETSRTLSTLFPSDVRERFDIDYISISCTTQAAMKNMLKRVSAILNSRGSPIIDVRQENINEILSNSVGDVRNAILNLIFNSLKVPDRKLKRDCENREESLGLLHGIGRVINPKRMQSGDGWKFVHDPDDITSYFQSQSTTFLHFLHENYMNTMSTIEDIELCAEIMSLSDMFTYEWRDSNLTKLNLSFCVRGIMVNNKNPVSGWNPVRKPRSEEVKLSRNLATAEERWYKSIICPRDNRDLSNLDNATIEQNSD